MIVRNNKVLKVNHKWFKNVVDPYNPLHLPPFTIRVKYKQGTEPEVVQPYPFDTHHRPYERTYTKTLVDAEDNIWDVTITDGQNDWRWLFNYGEDLLEVLGANSKGVNRSTYMFQYCNSLTSVALFDTSLVTEMGLMFDDCNSLTAVPLFDTSSAVETSYMFANCYNVQSGALALYQQASTQANPPLYHSHTFHNCGRNTVTGAAELAQIPTDWK